VAIQNIIDQTTPASEALSGLNGGNYTGDRDPQKAAHFMLAPNISQQFCLENGMGFLSVNPAVGIFFRVSRVRLPTKTRSADLHQDGLLLCGLGLLAQLGWNVGSQQWNPLLPHQTCW